ncbi:MAG: PmoA family protein, partial [Phycisphaerales bacterium]|nr:PmoA family protein [Phycisphaerales bacterium]
MLRDDVADHVHHHGPMFAVAVDRVDFWTETLKCGRQVGQRPETRADELVQHLDWTTPEGRVLLSEERREKAHPGLVTLLTWRSRLRVRDGVKLTGSHYFGLGMRFAAGMDKIGAFRNSANAP